MARDVHGYIYPEKRGDKKSRWFARYTFTDENGKRRNKKKLCPTQAKARKELARLIDDFEKRGDRGARGDRLTFNQLASEYEKTKLIEAEYRNNKKIRGRRSLNSAMAALKVLKEYFGSKRVRYIRHDEVEEFKHERLDTPTQHGGDRQIASVNRELELMRAILRFAVKNDYILKSPFEKGDLISKADETRRERVLSYDEERRLLDACGERTVTYKRKAHKRNGSKIAAKEITATDTGKRREHLRSLIIAALDTGARRGELRRLLWNDVDFESRELRLRAMTTKTLTARSIGMTQRLYDELQRLWLQSPQKLNQLVFGVGSVKTSFSAALEAASIDDFRWHDFRHTAITRMVAAGLPSAEVMKRSGHTQAQTFMRYVNPTSESARRSAERLEAHNAKASTHLTPASELVQ